MYLLIYIFAFILITALIVILSQKAYKWSASYRTGSLTFILLFGLIWGSDITSLVSFSYDCQRAGIHIMETSPRPGFYLKEMTDRDIAYYLKSGYAYVESDRKDQNSNTAKNYRFTESAIGEIHAEAIDKPGSAIYVSSDLIAHEKGVLEMRVTLMNRLEGKVLATKSSFMTYGEGLFRMLHALVDIRPEPLTCDGPRAEQITNVIIKAIPPKH